MKKIRNYLIAAVILTGLVFSVMALRSYYLFLKEPVAQLAGAIPVESAVVIKAGSLNRFAETVQSSALAGLLENSKIRYGFSTLALKSQSLTTLSSFFKEILEHDEVMMAIVPDKENQPDFLYATFIGKTKPGRITREIEDLYPGLKIEKIKNQHADIYHLSNQNVDVWYYISRGILAFTYNRDLLLSSLNTLYAPENLTSDKSFSRLMETSGKLVDGVVLIHNRVLASMLMQTEPGPLDFEGSPFTSWTTLDLKIKENKVLMDGFTATQTDDNLLEGQEAVSETILAQLPRETAFAVSLSMSNQLLYTEKISHNDTLQVAGYDSANRLISHEIFRRKEQINAWAGKNIAIAATDDYFNGNNLSRLLLIEVSNPDSARLALKPYLAPYDDTLQVFTAGNLPSRLWGRLFAINEKLYCHITNRFVLLSPSAFLLKQYLKNSQANLLLGTTQAYTSVSEQIGEKSNILVFIKPTACLPYLKRNVQAEDRKQSLNWAAAPAGSDLICIQYSGGGQLIYTHAFAITGSGNNLESSNNNSLSEQASSSTTTPDTQTSVAEKTLVSADKATITRENKAIQTALFAVKGKKSTEKRFILFAANHQVKCFTTQGHELWTFNCKDKPLGTVSEIDYYRNGGLQYIIATENQLHIIDTEGNELKTSPVRLKTGIKDEISVFDYDHKKDYRVVYQGTDLRLHNITLKGESLSDWQKPMADKGYSGQVQFIRTAGKDYLIAADNDGRLQITDRRGRSRIQVSAQFRKSANSGVYENATNSKGKFLMASAEGKLAYVDATGKTSESDFGNFGTDPFFQYLDFDKDGTPDFIFGGKERIVVFNRMKKMIGEINMKNADFGKPFISGSADRPAYLAVRDKKSGKVIVMNGKGKLITTGKLNSEADPVLIPTGKNNRHILVSISAGQPVITPVE